MDDYYLDNTHNDNRIVIGYSGINYDLIEDGIKLLLDIITKSIIANK